MLRGIVLFIYINLVLDENGLVKYNNLQSYHTFQTSPITGPPLWFLRRLLNQYEEVLVSWLQCLHAIVLHSKTCNLKHIKGVNTKRNYFLNEFSNIVKTEDTLVQYTRGPLSFRVMYNILDTGWHFDPTTLPRTENEVLSRKL